MDAKIAKFLSNAFHYLKEAEDEAEDKATCSMSEMRHLLGHVWYEVNALQNALTPEWKTGTGEDLPDYSWAHVVHPKIGVMFAQLGWYEDTSASGNTQKWYTWTDYTKGESVRAKEITHHIPVDMSLPPP